MKAEDVKVCVVRIEGTNCEDEMANAFTMVGATQASTRSSLIRLQPSSLIEVPSFSA